MGLFNNAKSSFFIIMYCLLFLLAWYFIFLCAFIFNVGEYHRLTLLLALPNFQVFQLIDYHVHLVNLLINVFFAPFNELLNFFVATLFLLLAIANVQDSSAHRTLFNIIGFYKALAHRSLSHLQPADDSFEETDDGELPFLQEFQLFAVLRTQLYHSLSWVRVLFSFKHQSSLEVFGLLVVLLDQFINLRLEVPYECLCQCSQSWNLGLELGLLLQTLIIRQCVGGSVIKRLRFGRGLVFVRVKLLPGGKEESEVFRGYGAFDVDIVQWMRRSWEVH